MNEEIDPEPPLDPPLQINNRKHNVEVTPIGEVPLKPWCDIEIYHWEGQTVVCAQTVLSLSQPFNARYAVEYLFFARILALCRARGILPFKL
jgi:hypothetical protein